MHDESRGKLGGEVEVDETFIGAKARNIYADKRPKSMRGKLRGKIAVMGLLERHAGGKSRVRTAGVQNTRRHHLQAQTKSPSRTARRSTRMPSRPTRIWTCISSTRFDHAEAYVNGQIHTNGLENYWRC
jgi:hypothetical protein